MYRINEDSDAGELRREDSAKLEEGCSPSGGFLEAAYGLSRWGERTWEFVAALLLLEISDQLKTGQQASLVLVASYGLLLSLCRFACGSLVGSALDRMAMSTGPRVFLFFQNVLVSISASCLALVMMLPMSRRVMDAAVMAAVASAVGGGMCSMGVSVGLEAKWVKAFYGHCQDRMAVVNARMRTIDLACQMLAPFLAGIIMTVLGPATAAAVIAIWHAIVWLPIISTLHAVYAAHAAGIHSRASIAGSLAQTESEARPESQRGSLGRVNNNTPTPLNEGAPKAGAAEETVERQSLAGGLDSEGADPRISTGSYCALSVASAAGEEEGGGGGGGTARVASEEGRLSAGESSAKASSRLWVLVEGFAVYFRQEMWPLLLALALLYFTVLSLGMLMTSYLKTTGMTEIELSIYRGIGGLTGMAAAALFPRVKAALGLHRGAQVGIVFQFVCLAVGVGAESLPLGGGHEFVTTRVLVGGLVLSRAGLWTFDLCVLQLMQCDVAEGELGRVGGIQSSLQSLFDAAMCASCPRFTFAIDKLRTPECVCWYTVALALPATGDFPILMLISVAAVGVAMTLTLVSTMGALCTGQLYSKLDESEPV